MPRGNSAYAGLFFFSITEIEWCGSWTPHPTLFPHWLINHRQPWSANCSASALVNRMGTILPLPFGSDGPSGPGSELAAPTHPTIAVLRKYGPLSNAHTFHRAAIVASSKNVLANRGSVARYAFVDKSILVVTEGLGPRRFHGRVVLMVNEHTASAGEMVAAFAEENKLATIVGTKTPGRLLSGGAFKVGHGYILGLPVAAYLTWQGRMLENDGIHSAVPTELPRKAGSGI